MQYTTKQYQAINTIDKNLQIIACAGSGKTQVISQRIVNILKTKDDIEPKNIIAFTYTDKAAAELKTRVLKLCREQIGDIQGIAEMYIGTIHSWCLQSLQDNIYEYQKFSILDEIKLKLFVDKYYSSIGMANVGMDRYKDTGRFINIMGLLRETDIAEGETLPEEWKEALQTYESKLVEHSYFDFTMIMTLAIKNIQDNPEYRAKLESDLEYLTVDEYQDVNPIQEQLVSELSKLNPNLCVVGDDDQTIYQWRGGDVRYIQDFKNKYPNVDYIKLEDNFRSTPGIIDAAQKSIKNNQVRLDKEMLASGHQQFEFGDILYNQFDDEYEEITFIKDTIKKLRDDSTGLTFQDKLDSTPRGLDYSDIVILVRTWGKARPIMEVLAEADIPFVVKGVNELFQRPEIKAAKAIFQYLKNEIEHDTLKEYWLAVSEEIKDEDLEIAINYLTTKIPKKNSYYSSFNIQNIFWDFIEKAKLSEETFVDPSKPTTAGNPVNEIIFYNLGMFSQMINDFESIYFKDQPVWGLINFLNFLKYSAENYYPEGWLNNTLATPNAVQIMTIHQAKGLEYPAVFIPGMNRNFFPLKKPGGKQIWHFIEKSLIKDQYRYETSVEDERRLFYVAITRSQKYLFITRAPENRMKKVESIFCKEISNSDFVVSSIDYNYSDVPRLPAKSKSEATSISLNFSVLKAHFDCPYRFKLISLYGFMQPISESMGYGNSLHNMLMEIHRRHLDGETITLEMLPVFVDRHLHLPYAVNNIIEDTRKTSTNVITDYFNENHKDFDNIEYAEKDIQLDLGDGIMVNGRMDLITKKDIAGNEITTIVDFKSKDDAQKLETTMDQLALYALGYKELTGKKADFLQIFALDEDGHRKQTQPLRNDKLDDIKKQIISSADDIRNNNLNKTNNHKNCNTCFHNRLCSGIPTINKK